MKFWRPGITGKLFLAIFATCIVLLISMHWAVRISFERGFIDYIKHGNEQRLQLLSDALGEQYGASCATMIALSFRSCVHLNTIIRKINPARVCHRTAGVPSSGWLIKTTKCWLVRERRFHLTVHGDPFWSTVRKLAR